MSPKEWKFLELLVEETARRAYERGRSDEKSNVEPPKSFALSKASRMSLQAVLENFLKKR